MQCQHVEDGKCVECSHIIFVRPPAQGNMKSDFRGFMNNVSRIIVKDTATQPFVDAVLIGIGIKQPIKQAA